MTVTDQIATLSVKEKISYFHFLAQGICLHARGLASDNRKPVDLRLLQSDGVVERLHRIFEQNGHYYKRDHAQRPDIDLFQCLQNLEDLTQLRGIVFSASEYALKQLANA